MLNPFWPVPLFSKQCKSFSYYVRLNHKRNSDVLRHDLGLGKIREDFSKPLKHNFSSIL